jgi:hypothetical protein
MQNKSSEAHVLVEIMGQQHMNTLDRCLQFLLAFSLYNGFMQCAQRHLMSPMHSPISSLRCTIWCQAPRRTHESNLFFLSTCLSTLWIVLAASLYHAVADRELNAHVCVIRPLRCYAQLPVCLKLKFIQYEASK